MPVPKLVRAELSVGECRACGKALVNELERDTVVRRDVWVCPGECPGSPPVCGLCGSEMTRSTYGGKCPNECFTIRGRVRKTMDRLQVG